MLCACCKYESAHFQAVSKDAVIWFAENLEEWLTRLHNFCGGWSDYNLFCMQFRPLEPLCLLYVRLFPNTWVDIRL